MSHSAFFDTEIGKRCDRPQTKIYWREKSRMSESCRSSGYLGTGGLVSDP